MPSTPVARTLDQRLEALKVANEVRSARANLKKMIFAGSMTASECLLTTPHFLLTMRLTILLGSLRGVGTMRVMRMMNQCRISHNKTVGGLSTRQRHELVTLLEGA